jgi:hypothetical protein
VSTAAHLIRSGWTTAAKPKNLLQAISNSKPVLFEHIHAAANICAIAVCVALSSVSAMAQEAPPKLACDEDTYQACQKALEEQKAWAKASKERPIQPFHQVNLLDGLRVVRMCDGIIGGMSFAADVSRLLRLRKPKAD